MSMHRYAALALLMGFGVKSRARQIGRAFRTVRGVLAFTFGVAIFGSWLAMSLVGLIMGAGAETHRQTVFDHLPVETIQIYIALLLLGYCLITFFFRKQGAGVQFKPAEVDFLFGGPYGRREILLYKLLGLAGSVVFSALIFSVFLSWMPIPWPILFLGLALAIVFAILLNVLASIATLALATRLHRRSWRVAATVAVLALGAGAYALVHSAGMGNVTERGLEVARSPLGQIILAPFLVYARAVTALDYAAFSVHAAMAVAINLGVVGLILYFDADYYESSIDASRKTYERLRRMREGDLFGADVTRRGSWNLPEFPRLGGVGPVAWRQALTAVRSLPRLLFLLGLFVLPGAFLFIGDHRHEFAQWILSYLALMLLIFVPSAFRFDFRSDLNKMSWLKALPVPSWAVVVGQLAPAVLVLVAIEALLIALIAGMAGRPTYLAWLPVLPGAAFILFGIENAIFLFFPTRRFAMYPGDFQNLGYTYLVAFAKIMVLGVVFGAVAAVAAALRYLLLVPIPIISLVVAALLLCIAMACIPVLTYAYNRFDPSVDTPLD